MQPSRNSSKPEKISGCGLFGHLAALIAGNNSYQPTQSVWIITCSHENWKISRVPKQISSSLAVPLHRPFVETELCADCSASIKVLWVKGSWIWKTISPVGHRWNSSFFTNHDRFTWKLENSSWFVASSQTIKSTICRFLSSHMVNSHCEGISLQDSPFSTQPFREVTKRSQIESTKWLAAE